MKLKEIIDLFYSFVPENEEEKYIINAIDFFLKSLITPVVLNRKLYLDLAMNNYNAAITYREKNE